MKRYVLVLTLLMAAAGAKAMNNVAEDDMAAAEATITAECKDESKQAESPEIYFDECVAERLQALRDEQGGSGDLPPDRG